MSGMITRKKAQPQLGDNDEDPKEECLSKKPRRKPTKERRVVARRDKNLGLYSFIKSSFGIGVKIISIKIPRMQ
jgi:hypothetical protein